MVNSGVRQILRTSTEGVDNQSVIKPRVDRGPLALDLMTPDPRVEITRRSDREVERFGWQAGHSYSSLCA